MNRLIALISILSLTCVSQAQVKPVPPPADFKPETSEPKKPLPVLTLPQYIITGSEVINFTENRKASIALLNPDAFSARAGRGAREAGFSDAGPYGEPLTMQSLHGNEGVLLARAGYGTFHTPYLVAWYADAFLLGDLSAHALYRRSDGFVRLSDFIQAHVDISGGTYLPVHSNPIVSKSRLQGNFHIAQHEYALYANWLKRDPPILDFKRVHTEVRYGADLLSRRNTIVDYELQMFAEHTLLREGMSLRDSIELNRFRFHENTYGISAEAQPRISGHEVQTSFALAVSDNSRPVQGGVSPVFFRSQAATHFAPWTNTTLDVGISFYLFKGSLSGTRGRVYPDLRLAYFLDDDVQVFGAFRSEVQRISMKSLLASNPYVILGPELRHTDMPINLGFGVAYDNRMNRSARLTFLFEQASSYPRFHAMETAEQQWIVRYDGTTSIFTARGDATFRLTESGTLIGRVVARTSDNSVLSASLPYLPDFEAHAVYAHRFPFELDVTAGLQLVGKRTGDSGTLPSFLLPAVELEYHITRNFGVFLHLNNVLDRKYELWRAYQERPLFVLGGATLRL